MSPEVFGHPLGQLVDVYLWSANFSRNADFEFDPENPVTYVLDSRSEALISPDRTAGTSYLHAEVEWRLAEGEVAQGPFDLKISIAGIFEWSAPDREPEDIQGWIEFNSQHLLWPYLRAHITDLTASAGLPPLILYTIGIPNPKLGAAPPAETPPGG